MAGTASRSPSAPRSGGISPEARDDARPAHRRDGRHRRLAIPMLLERGYAVTAVGRTVEKRARLASLGADALALDLFDGKSACAAMKRHDAVINLATHMPSSVFRMLLP